MRATPSLPYAAAVLCAALAVLAAPPATAATALDVQTTRVGDIIQVQAQAIVHAPLAVVWATLTDYERLPEFVPGLKTSRVVTRKGATATVAQTGEAKFLFFTVPIEVTVESTELPPHAIEARRVSGTLRHLQGRYEMHALGSHPPHVQLRWTGGITPESDLPPLIGQSLMRSMITEQFSGMVREMERRAVAASTGGLAATVAQPPAPASPSPGSSPSASPSASVSSP
jgi:ribosome-associated toxin RatA of RatAB toxin-antitoxin module